MLCYVMLCYVMMTMTTIIIIDDIIATTTTTTTTTTTAAPSVKLRRALATRLRRSWRLCTKAPPDKSSYLIGFKGAPESFKHSNQEVDINLL